MWEWLRGARAQQHPLIDPLRCNSHSSISPRPAERDMHAARIRERQAANPAALHPLEAPSYVIFRPPEDGERAHFCPLLPHTTTSACIAKPFGDRPHSLTFITASRIHRITWLAPKSRRDTTHPCHLTSPIPDFRRARQTLPRPSCARTRGKDV